MTATTTAGVQERLAVSGGPRAVEVRAAYPIPFSELAQYVRKPPRYLLLARAYQFNAGRFVQVDPTASERLEGSISWNRYAYANDTPMSMTDPTGRFALFGFRIGGTIGRWLDGLTGRLNDASGRSFLVPMYSHPNPIIIDYKPSIPREVGYSGVPFIDLDKFTTSLPQGPKIWYDAADPNSKATPPDYLGTFLQENGNLFGGFTAQDDKCSVIGCGPALDQMPFIRATCIRHDACYREHWCNFTSWLTMFLYTSPCGGCNWLAATTVIDHVVTTSVP